MKKEKKTINQKKTIKLEKKEKEKKHAKKEKPTYHRVNGPDLRRAHAGGAEFRSANGRIIGIA
jgi:hypothetical protein